MIMYELIDIMTTVGTPIGLCVYLLYERDRTTKKMTDALNNLTIAIEKMSVVR